MAEILKNTGAKLWSMVDDHDELQSNVFDQLFGTGGKSDIRLIDEAIGKINESLNGYYFKIINDKLYICKDTESGTTSLPLSITDDDGHVALKVDGTSITIDGNGVVHGATIDDAFSLTSENAVQNKVVKAKFDEVDGKINANETTILSHKNDQNNPHNVTKSQLNLGNVEDKSSETIRGEITKENVTNALGYTPYTPNEVDNKFSTLETNIDWKEAVDTFADIAVAYPSPEDGWTVNTKDNNITYRYNGSEWVAISANAIPKATNSVDGLLSKEDHAKYDDAVSKAHSHDNKSVLDGITSDKVTAWDNKSDFSGNYLDLNNKPTIPKGDGTTITMDEDGTLHGQSKVDEMTGATAEKDGTSGTVPAPKVSDKDKFLRGDGTWAEAKQDLSAYYNNADYTNNKLQLKHDDKVLKEFEIKGSGGATITPKPTVNPQIKNDDKKVIITWEDPTDTVIEGSTFSKWAGTKLVMKESGYPTSPDDGTVLVDNTTRDKYKTTGFEKSGLTNDKQYYFALFPYSTDGVYNYDSGNRLLGEPTELKIVTFAGGTDAEIAKMIQAHYNDKINIADYWAVGDTRSVSLSAMSATGVGESHRAQTVQFVIGDFNHDDLTTPINGHTKAAVTLLQKDCLMDATSASNVNNGSADTEKGYMNSTNTNAGGWKNCARRTWCNNVFFAALPSAWQSIVKTVNKKSGTGGGSSSGTEVTTDKIFLASEIEIFGSRSYSVDGEGAQYQYYKNATANRYKMPKWGSSSVTHIYWERSPISGNAAGFCTVTSVGNADFYYASSASGVAPCLCI